MKRRMWILEVCFLAAAALAVAACRMEARPTAAPDAAATTRPPVAVSVAPATTSDLTETLDVVGSLTPKFFADVKSEITGTIAAVFVSDWVPVKKGALLARLETSEIEASIEALRAVEAQSRVAEARARREHDRALQLEQFGLITTQALDDARTAVEAAAAATAATRAQIRTAQARFEKSSFKSPMDGVVAERRISVGDRVENMGGGEPMFRVVDNRVLDLTVTVTSARLPSVRVGQPLTFTTDAVPGRTFEGRVMFINPSVDDVSRSAKVIAAVQNTDGALRSGLFVRGRIVTSTRRNVLQIPRRALVNWNVDDCSAELFVVADDHAEKRSVTIGVAGEERVEITAGLSLGEQVVTRGGFALRPGDRVSVGTGRAGG